MIATPWIVGGLALAIPTLIVICAVIAGGTQRDTEWALDPTDRRHPLDELEGPD